MKLTSPILALFFLAALTATSQARLGETMAECERRLGEGHSVKWEALEWFPIKGSPEMIYRYKDWIITIVFVNGMSAREMYFKSPPDDYSKQTISTAEAENLLEANRSADNWSVKKEGELWVRTDGAIGQFMSPDRFYFDSPSAHEGEKAAAPKF